jgi:DNA-binding beta-propeller fold protein YncE
MKTAILLLFIVVGTLAGAVQTPGNAAYVVDMGTGKVWVIDLGRRLMDSAISTGDGAAAMTVLPNNRRGFVVNRDA